MSGHGARIVDVEFITTKGVTAVEVVGRVCGKIYKGAGAAKKFPEDKENKDIGTHLAFGRALVSLGKHIQRRGYRLSKKGEPN